MARFKVAHPSSTDHLKYCDEENALNDPQKEPLRFHLDTSLLAPHLVDLVLEIQRVAENTLFHWKTFPLNLPQHLAVQEFSEGSASTRRKPLIVESLFNLPSWDELDIVSVDARGEAKRLSTKQLTSVRQDGISEKNGSWRLLTAEQLRSINKTGSFTVPSVNFAGQHHTWRVNPLLLTGTEVAMESLQTVLAWAAATINLTAVERFSGQVFSVRQSFHSLQSGFHRLLDLLFGMPSLQPRDFEARLNEERSRYLVAELLCAIQCQEDYIALCRFFRHQLPHQNPGSSGRMLDIRQQKIPTLPYIFQTPKGLLIDLRLFSRDVMDRVKPLVNAILQQESKARWSCQRGPEFQRKHNEATCVTGTGSSDANDYDENLNRIWESVQCNADIELLGSGVGQLLVDHAKAVLTMKRAVSKVREQFTADLIQAEVDIRLRHPMLSLVKPWMDKQLSYVKAKLAKEFQWKCHEEAIEACRRQSLDSFVYFLSRDLAFLRDRAPILSKELWDDKKATRTFLWDTWTWNPRSWVIRRHFQGSIEVITTHVSNTPTSITSPRDTNGGQEQPVYTLEKSSRRTTTTQWALWRWANFLQRSWAWSWNAAYTCGYLVPWCSPIGIRALTASQPFYADLELSQVNGVLCPRRTAFTPTLSSRLASLWRHISKSRTEFETKPDTGFFGKGFTRQFNRAWNYGVKGILCSLLLLVFFPLICIFCSIGGVSLALAAPIWAPIAAFLYHICIVLLWDADNPDTNKNPLLPLVRVLFQDILLGGILQPVACLATALVLCPLISFLLATYGILRWLLVSLRDRVIYGLFIKSRSRIPASEGCLVKRIAGPGLDTNFYYQISKEQALAAFEARLEADRLIAYRRQTERLIRRPIEEFRLFVQQVFSPFCGSAWVSTPVADKPVEKNETAASASLKTSHVAVQLERETQSLLTLLDEKVERRMLELRMPLNPNVLKKIKLSSCDLKAVLIRSAVMMRSFYPSEILARLGVNESELWERYNVEENDWLALSAIVLGEIFSPAILTPLVDEDTRIQLEAKETNLNRYTGMFCQADIENEPFEWPHKATPLVTPMLPDFACFNPLTRDAINSSPPWKKKRTNPLSERSTGGNSSWMAKSTVTQELNPSPLDGKLLIPLPIPHPILICLLIYNRHRDSGAIPLESETCRLLIRFVEGSAIPYTRSKELIPRTAAVDPGASRSPASHKPLLGSSGSDLALSQPSLAASNTPSSSPSQHDTLVSLAQDGTLSLVGTLVSEHASVDIDMGLDQENVTQNFSASRNVDSEASSTKGLSSTLARAADTLRVVLLGEKAEESSIGSASRKYSAENFELLPSCEDPEVGAIGGECTEQASAKKKFPAYQPASFRSWRMNLPTPLRYESNDPRLRISTSSNEVRPVQPNLRPLGLFELSTGLASDRGPAFSPAQLSIGRKLMANDEATISGSQDSLPFAEEDASFVDTPDWDISKNASSSRKSKQDAQRHRLSNHFSEMQQPKSSAVLASLEDLSLSLESQHTHNDITSKLGTQV